MALKCVNMSLPFWAENYSSFCQTNILGLNTYNNLMIYIFVSQKMTLKGPNLRWYPLFIKRGRFASFVSIFQRNYKLSTSSQWSVIGDFSADHHSSAPGS